MIVPKKYLRNGDQMTEDAIRLGFELEARMSPRASFATIVVADLVSLILLVGTVLSAIAIGNTVWGWL